MEAHLHLARLVARSKLAIEQPLQYNEENHMEESTNPTSRTNHSVILLRELVLTDFKLRYQGSVLGYIWSLLRPLALFIILYFIFVRFLKVGNSIPHSPVYLLLGIVVWNYFAEVTNGGVAAIVSKGDLIRKINFPKYVIVLAGSLSALINLVINLGVVGVFMIINKVPIMLSALWAPLLIVELFVFAIGVAFLLSAIFVRLRDMNYIWEVFMQGFFYATPILYPVALLPAGAAKILILSPIAQIIQDLRYSLITHQSETIGTIYHNEWMRIVPVMIVILLAVFAWKFFTSRQDSFAEDI